MKMVCWVLLVCAEAWILGSVHGATDSTDVSALKSLYSSLNSAYQLTGWTSNGGDPCGQSWRGVKCSGSAVTGIKLAGLELTGSLGYLLPSMSSLIELDLSSNNLGGGQIPYNLPPNLQQLNLAGNGFTGDVPYSISSMVSLKYLNLNHNQLQGNLNDMFGKLSNLSTIGIAGRHSCQRDFSFNSLTGELPESFSNLSSLTTLYLQNNQLTGTIDTLSSLPLENLNVANNHFFGWVPDQLRGIKNLQTGGNSWNSGPAPPPPPGTRPHSRRMHPGHRYDDSKSPPKDSSKENQNSSIHAGGIAGIIMSVLAVGAMLAFFWIRRKKKRAQTLSHKEQKKDRFLTSSAPKVLKGTMPSPSFPAADSETTKLSVPDVLKPPSADRNSSLGEKDSLSNPAEKKLDTTPIKATSYSVADLQMATGSFSIDNFMGEGSIGRVYRASFKDGRVLAVKKINSFALPNLSKENFIEVVTNISHLHHPNICELVGYCLEHNQRILVYEYYKSGSLHDLLHLVEEYSKPLPWSVRVNIALGSARALEYLHEICCPSVLYKNFKSANVLLDTELSPHLSDCGLASIVPDFDYQAIDHNMTSGYAAPEVSMSGKYSLKTDVYSFGVVMLELLTGRKPFDSSRPRPEQSLVQWAAPQLHDIDALDKMVDPALEGLYPAKALARFADVISVCVQAEPEFRPPMSEVVQALVRLLQRVHMSKRTRSLDNVETPRRADAAAYGESKINDMLR